MGTRPGGQRTAERPATKCTLDGGTRYWTPDNTRAGSRKRDCQDLAWLSCPKKPRCTLRQLMFWDRLQLYLTPISCIQRFRWGILYAFYFYSMSTGKTPQMSLQSFNDHKQILPSQIWVGGLPSVLHLACRTGEVGRMVWRWFPLFPCEMSAASCFIQSLGNFWRGATRIFWKMLGSRWNKWRLRFWSHTHTHTMFYVFFGWWALQPARQYRGWKTLFTHIFFGLLRPVDHKSACTTESFASQVSLFCNAV